MLKKIFTIVFCILFFACSKNKQVIIPATVLPVEKMAAVMVDIHLTEAAMNLNTMNPENASVGGNTISSIDALKKNNITKEQYDASFLFYSQNPALFTEIYQLVLNDLSKMQAQVTNEK